jgi:hypothetical protein
MAVVEATRKAERMEARIGVSDDVAPLIVIDALGYRAGSGCDD